jgi:chaperonin cofactor prefoldin
MEEKIELNAFLNRLVSDVIKKFEKIESDLSIIKTDMDRLKQSDDKSALKALDDRLKNLEFSVNSLKNKSQIDKSILKLIETEEQERKGDDYARRL